MNKEKLFNDWIARNFRGLSANTLVQFLMCESSFYGKGENRHDCSFKNYFKDMADNIVYYILWNVFVGKATDDDYSTFEIVKTQVANCSWL